MNVAPRPQLAGLSLFAGVGMLDEGARAGFDYLGFDYRCVGYIERDAYAASALVARMESAALDQALVWDDITSFDGRRWRGKVDCIVAGFPCQDISVAGRRAGLDGARSGLFYEVLRVAADCGAPLLFLENVAGIASAGASVMDEAEGDLIERAAARVVGELADRGWDAEWLHLRASDVGASHRRERWFCLAWRRVADAELPERRSQRAGGDCRGEGRDGERQADGGAGIAEQVFDHATGTRCDRTRERTTAEQQSGECLLGAGCEVVADASKQRRQQIAGCALGDEGAHEGWPEDADHEPVGADAAVANAARGGERIGQRQHAAPATGPESRAEGCGEDVADSARLPGWQRAGRERVLDRGSQLDDAESERRRQGRAEHARIEGRHAAAEHGGELGLADGPYSEGGGEAR